MGAAAAQEAVAVAAVVVLAVAVEVVLAVAGDEKEDTVGAGVSAC